jgi:hypothetical protein
VTRPTADAHEEGAVAVVVALLSTVLLIFAAFAADIGNAWAQSRQLSVSADSAALSAAKRVGLAMPRNTDCTPQVLTSINATQIARTEADAMNTANSPTGASEPVDGVAVACAAGGDAVEVTISNSRGVKTQLAGLIGIDQIRPNSYAVARYFRTPTAGGLRPWAVCRDTVVLAQANPGTTYATGLDNQAGVCGTTASGNWGGVDFDGGSNAAGDLAAWTQNGYPGSVTIPDPALPADPGISNSSGLGTAFTSLVNQVVLFPTARGYNGGNGNNASFDAVGVVSVKVCGVYYANTTYNIDANGVASDCWVDPLPTTSSQSTVTTGTVNATNNSTTLTAPVALFTPAMVGAQIVVTNANGNNNNPSNLTTTIAAYVSPTQVTLANRAGRTATGTTATITVTTTTTTPGLVPTQANGRPIGHIQFRYVDYVSSFTGSSTVTPCNLADSAQCAGVVALWR